MKGKHMLKKIGAALAAVGGYLLNVLVALDRVANAILRGDPDETLSSVAYRVNRDKGWWRFTMPIINRLFWFQPAHCFVAYTNDRKRVLKP
jgi:hypothetical protein